MKYEISGAVLREAIELNTVVDLWLVIPPNLVVMYNTLSSVIKPTVS
jgi:hypothetical protein